MKDVKKLAYYFKKYSLSLQKVSFERLGNFYHDNFRRPSDFIYLCPLCLKNKIGMVGDYLHYDEEFTLDHFPPTSVGGKDTVLVCKTCNDKAGLEFDYSLKEWLNEQSFIKRVPNAKLPVKIQPQDLTGKYKGNLKIEDDKISFDDFCRYPFVNDSLLKVTQGHIVEQTITFQSPKMEFVYKALIKTAYLHCFSIWGYDFVYSETALQIRNILFKNEIHPLSNYGTFFHMDKDDNHPPIGLCYVFKPVELQTFMITFKLISKEIDFECAVSILIPGSEKNNWGNINAYQPIIDTQEDFNFPLIRLPENELTNTNLFPYTNTWNQRLNFKIVGENYFNS